MSRALTKFSEETKTSFYAVTAGMFLVAVAAATCSLTGKFASSMLRLLGIAILTVTVVGLVGNLSGLYASTPNPMRDQSIMTNVASCSALCMVVIAIIAYGSYTLVF